MLAGHDPLGEEIFVQKQKEILANVSNSQQWLSVGCGGGQAEGTFEEREQCCICFP